MRSRAPGKAVPTVQRHSGARHHEKSFVGADLCPDLRRHLCGPVPDEATRRPTSAGIDAACPACAGCRDDAAAVCGIAAREPGDLGAAARTRGTDRSIGCAGGSTPATATALHQASAAGDTTGRAERDRACIDHRPLPRPGTAGRTLPQRDAVDERLDDAGRLTRPACRSCWRAFRRCAVASGRTGSVAAGQAEPPGVGHAPCQPENGRQQRSSQHAQLRRA